MSFLPFFGQSPNRKDLILVTPPESEPVTLEQVKDFLLVDGTQDDNTLNLLIKTAREAAEQFMNRAIINQGYKLIIDQFNDRDYINLPKGLVQEVTGITVYNLNNTSYTVDPSIYTIVSQDRIALNYDQVWPLALRNRASVEINYTVGYGADSTSVPASIQMAILLHVSAMYQSRGTCDMPPDAKSLLNPFRIYPYLGMD